MAEPLRLSPFDIYLDPLLGLQDARLREMLTYWQGKKLGKALPARVDVKPGEIISHLPSLFLVGVDQPATRPENFKIRLMGTALNELAAADFTGKRLNEVVPTVALSTGVKLFSIVAQLRRPIRVFGHATFESAKRPVAIEALLMPLSIGGTHVDVVMGELLRRASPNES
ncbi:MAG: PAS domain-containing protein [Rhizobiales bacterium]|nr:PAS domain-containing protein [Hyphomicrobiales bacterium]